MVDRNTFVQEMHRILANRLMKNVALQIIGSKWYVFCDDSFDMLEIVNEMKANERLTFVCKLSDIKNVDTNSIKQWLIQYHKRIPTRKADRRPGAPLRRAIMQQLDEQMDNGSATFVNITSSSKQSYRYYLVNEYVSAPDTVTITPNGYGFSNSTTKFALPVLHEQIN